MAITDNATHALLIDGEDFLRAQRAARGLEAGTVWIDEHLAGGSEMPHGGVKRSGFGKDMSMYALEDSYDAVSSR